MSEFVVDIELSLTVEEVANLTKLSKHLDKPMGDIVRECMNEKIEERLSTIDVE